MGTAVYEQIGSTYASTRRADPRIAAQVSVALGEAMTVLNVGAGVGSYEPDDRFVVGLDPSATMLSQRAGGGCPAVLGRAESLPFADGTFDAAMATLTLHHWTDLAAGLAEMRRVSARQVAMVYETSAAHSPWIVDYFPACLALPHERRAPSAESLREHLNVVEIQVVQVWHDCADGFGGAYWRRPERYLDPLVQAGMSMLALLTDAERAVGTQRLSEDLASGDWIARYGHLLDLESIDLGYRLVIADD